MEDMRKLLLGYRDNMRVEVESGVAVKAKTVRQQRRRRSSARTTFNIPKVSGRFLRCGPSIEDSD
jgi:hypothetical protein